MSKDNVVENALSRTKIDIFFKQSLVLGEKYNKAEADNGHSLRQA